MSNSDERTTYENYYARTIDERLQADDLTGLKLVVGPTGLGKTCAIPLVIYSQRQPATTRERNSIYLHKSPAYTDPRNGKRIKKPSTS